MFNLDTTLTIKYNSGKLDRQKIIAIILILILLWVLTSPVVVDAFAGFGGYISEQLLGDGTNENRHLWDGTNELMVVGSGPVINTQPVTNNVFGSCTLHGNLANLNGMPMAEYWFVWGTTPAMGNTTPVTTTTTTGDKTAVISPFPGGVTFYYQFRSATDGTSQGATLTFVSAAGPTGTGELGHSIIQNLLPIGVAITILIFILTRTRNLIVVLVGTTIGMIGFYIVKAMIEAIF